MIEEKIANEKINSSEFGIKLWGEFKVHLEVKSTFFSYKKKTEIILQALPQKKHTSFARKSAKMEEIYFILYMSR